MGNLKDFGEDMRACAVYHPETGIFESVIIMPQTEMATYETGNELIFEWIDHLDVVPLEQMSKGKIIRRVGVQQYEIQDAPADFGNIEK